MANIYNMNAIEKVAAVRKIMKPEYAAGIDDLISIIFHNEDPFAIANNSFNYGYYQGVMAERATEQEN